jgi:hypothetical protein
MAVPFPFLRYDFTVDRSTLTVNSVTTIDEVSGLKRTSCRISHQQPFSVEKFPYMASTAFLNKSTATTRYISAYRTRSDRTVALPNCLLYSCNRSPTATPLQTTLPSFVSSFGSPICSSAKLAATCP